MNKWIDAIISLGFEHRGDLDVPSPSVPSDPREMCRKCELIPPSLQFQRTCFYRKSLSQVALCDFSGRTNKAKAASLVGQIPDLERVLGRIATLANRDTSSLVLINVKPDSSKSILVTCHVSSDQFLLESDSPRFHD